MLKKFLASLALGVALLGLAGVSHAQAASDAATVAPAAAASAEAASASPAAPAAVVSTAAEPASAAATPAPTPNKGDALHWGEGAVSIGPQAIRLVGRLAPGPDYKLYLSPEFVETEADFKRLKPQMSRVGDVKTFNNFIVPLPQGVDPAKFNTVIVWCETFSEFITAAKYQ